MVSRAYNEAQKDLKSWTKATTTSWRELEGGANSKPNF